MSASASAFYLDGDFDGDFDGFSLTECTKTKSVGCLTVTAAQGPQQGAQGDAEVPSAPERQEPPTVRPRLYPELGGQGSGPVAVVSTASAGAPDEIAREAVRKSTSPPPPPPSRGAPSSPPRRITSPRGQGGRLPAAGEEAEQPPRRDDAASGAADCRKRTAPRPPTQRQQQQQQRHPDPPPPYVSYCSFHNCAAVADGPADGRREARADEEHHDGKGRGKCSACGTCSVCGSRPAPAPTPTPTPAPTLTPASTPFPSEMLMPWGPMGPMCPVLVWPVLKPPPFPVYMTQMMSALIPPPAPGHCSGGGHTPCASTAPPPAQPQCKPDHEH